MKILLPVLTAVAMIPYSASAAVSLKIEGGKLVGATGVEVGSQRYDVEFLDGSCDTLFNMCSVFNFNSEAAAREAATALSTAVFIDDARGRFDSFSDLTAGCESINGCSVFIPYRRNTNQRLVDIAFFTNRSSLSGGVDFVGSTTQFASSTTLTAAGQTYARFTVSAAVVPELTTWALMIVGFGMVAGAVRYRRRELSITCA